MDDEIPPISNEIIQFLRAIASAQDDHEVPLLDAPANDIVHLRAEREESDDHNDNRHEDEYDQNRNQGNLDSDRLDDENEEDEEEQFRRRQRRDALRFRLRDRGLSAGRHDGLLDWADLLLQIEDQSVTFLEFEDGYIGNPDDYVDETAYNSLLQTLAEGDNNERRGAPPASRLAIEALQTVEVNATSTELCAVCNDEVFNNEHKTVKQLPCGHMYHGICITPWLDSRNTCPVCRHELPTDDPEYEEDRRQRSVAMAATIDHGARAV